jgi:DNA-binding GntR family transcriptional regulator/transposase
VADNGRRLSSADREMLLRTARSRQSSHGVAIRARLVVDSDDLGVAEAARRSSVSQATVAKWWRRYLDAGVDGLRDAPHTGRPPASDEVVRRVLTCTLEEPPAGTERWTTRTVADVTGVSQATVSRIRRRYFRSPEPNAAAFLRGLSTSILTYVDVHPSGCALGFHTSTGASAGGTTAARTDVIETIICAALLRSPVRGHVEPADDASDAVAVLRRAAERLSFTPTVTLIIDAELDAAARHWLSHHPEIKAHTVTGDGWLGMLHRVADAVDPRQLAELREVQRLIRHARRDTAEEFTWRRATPTSSSAARTVSDADTESPAGNLTPVVRGICTAIADGELQAGDSISARHIARRSGVSPGRVADALAQLAEEALIDRHGGRYLVPVPTPRDVIETYTARGLLGTAITRRLASDRIDLPTVVDELFASLIRCDELGRTYEASTIDLDLQDELAAAATMPRIGSMFIRLTLQLRLFVTIFGLNYRYPTDEIVADDQRILVEIRRHDPDGAVSAWRCKIDNCARFMLTHLRPIE